MNESYKLSKTPEHHNYLKSPISEDIILVYLGLNVEYVTDFEYFKSYFAGCVKCLDETDDNFIIKSKTVYLCGDVDGIMKKCMFYDKLIYPNTPQIYVVKDFASSNFPFDCNVINKTKLPLNLHNIGVFINDYFDRSYFESIESEHQFQELTETNKPSISYRKGIYLSNVQKEGDALRFNLMRCSTNFSGPSENFCTTDREIIGQVNSTIKELYSDKTINMNHVLAQIYNNCKINKKEKKAKIKKHSDKTKDMPENALIAFCTFYKGEVSKDNRCLTRLRFKLKKANCALIDQYDVVLYPNSIFIITLEANRLYTHEIIPSILPIDKIPIRLGYIIRCSNVEAVFENGRTCIIKGDDQVEMLPATDNDVQDLKQLYYLENTTTDIVKYNDIYFSLNKGDYIAPKL